MNKEIAILLPYKEKYTKQKAGAASIWVNDYFKFSKHTNNTIVFGNLENNDSPLTANFTNLNLKKFRLKKNTRYTELFYNKILNTTINVIEIHNRPESLLFLLKKKN